jgi:hypothetical protein
VGQAKRPPPNVGTPEVREAVRSQLVGRGLGSSRAIAAELGVPHETVARILRRFEALGCLRLAAPSASDGGPTVEPGSLSDRFRDLSLPLW